MQLMHAGLSYMMMQDGARILVWEEHRANRSDKGCKTVAAFRAHYFADW